MPNPLWSIVLAAGSGRRLAAVTGGIPKQFWSPRGDRTLLEATLERTGPLAPPARTLTVVDRTHHAYVDAFDRDRTAPLGRILRQPADRGTAAGVLLALHELAASPEALVMLTPSDHGVADPEVFRAGVRVAAEAVRRKQAEIVLFAVAPASPSGDFGWIMPTPGASGTLGRVASFVEKPEPALAGRLLAEGGVWNTMVTVCRAGALLQLYHRHLPELLALFEESRRLPAAAREAFLAASYDDLPRADFCRDLLTPAQGLHLFVWPDALGWTDLGTPDRLRAWLTAPGTSSPVAGVPEPSGLHAASRRPSTTAAA